MRRIVLAATFDLALSSAVLVALFLAGGNPGPARVLWAAMLAVNTATVIIAAVGSVLRWKRGEAGYYGGQLLRVRWSITFPGRGAKPSETR